MVADKEDWYIGNYSIAAVIYKFPGLDGPRFWSYVEHGRYGFDLTHWDRDEINNISQTLFSKVFSSKKMFEFRLKFR